MDSIAITIGSIDTEILKADQELRKMLILVKSSENPPHTILEEMTRLEGVKKDLQLEKELLMELIPAYDTIDEEEVVGMVSNLKELFTKDASLFEKRRFVERFIPGIDIYPYERAIIHLSPIPSRNNFIIGHAGEGTRTPTP